MKPTCCPHCGKSIEVVKGKARASSLEEVIEFCSGQAICRDDAEWFWWKCEGCDWTNGGKPIKNWQATLRAWQAAKYLPSQKQGGQRATFAEKPRKLSVWELKQVVDAKEARCTLLKGKFASEGPLSTEWNSEAARTEWRGLRMEIKLLNEQLRGAA